MKISINIKKAGLLLAMGAVFFTACNKLELDPVPNPTPVQGTTPTLANLLDDPAFSILKAAAVKAATFPTTPSVLQLLSVPNLRFTVFAPDDAAFARSGIPSAAALAFFSPGKLDTVLRYHIVPQELKSGLISAQFPNFEYPSIFNPAPTVSPFARFSLFPSVRSGVGAWVNNVPLTGLDIEAVNGVLHKTFALVVPPSISLWDTIFHSTDLSYLQAALQRADSGVAVGSRLRDALEPRFDNPNGLFSNLTILAPTDAAMQQFLVGSLYKALLARITPQPPTALDSATAFAQATGAVNAFGLAILIDPYHLLPPPYNTQLATAFSPTVVRGLLAYHVLSAQSGSYAPPGIRVFSVNMPATATAAKTLLNTVFAAHPGVTLQAVFASPAPGISIAVSATVKGAANATPSNITTRDIHCYNGVMHKIDQVLIPQ